MATSPQLSPPQPKLSAPQPSSTHLKSQAVINLIALLSRGHPNPPGSFHRRRFSVCLRRAQAVGQGLPHWQQQCMLCMGCKHGSSRTIHLLSIQRLVTCGKAAQQHQQQFNSSSSSSSSNPAPGIFDVSSPLLYLLFLLVGNLHLLHFCCTKYLTCSG
jgi:hypothetical protein